MEKRDAVVITFTLKEVAEALSAYAKQRGQEVPNHIDNVKIDVNTEKNIIVCTFIGPANLQTVGNA